MDELDFSSSANPVPDFSSQATAVLDFSAGATPVSYEPSGATIGPASRQTVLQGLQAIASNVRERFSPLLGQTDYQRNEILAAGGTPDTANEPAVHLPRISGATSTLGQIASGSVNAVESLIEGATTGPSILGIVSGAAIPKVVGGVFAGEMVRTVGGPAQAAGTASVTGTPQEKTETYLGLGAHAALPVLLGAHAARPGVIPELPKVDLPAVKEVAPEVAKVAEAAPEIPVAKEAPKADVAPAPAASSVETVTEARPDTTAGAPQTKDELAASGMELARNLAKNYPQLDAQDAESVAMAGLAKAVEAFDPAKGAKFTTLAYRSIENALKDEVSKASALKRGGGEKPVNLDERIGAEGDQTVGSVVPDESAPNPERVAALNDAYDQVKTAKAKLPADEQSLLTDLEAGKSLSDMAKDRGVDQSAIARTLKRAMRAIQEETGLSRDDVFGLKTGPIMGDFSSFLTVPGVDKLDAVRKSIVSTFKALPERDIIAARSDAASTQAKITGQQAGNRVRLLAKHSTADLEALPFVIEAKGSLEKLKADAAKIKGKGYDLQMAKAIKDFDRLSTIAKEVDAIHDQQLADERSSGMDVDQVEAYVAHRYDMDVFNAGKSPLVLDATGGRGSSSFFKKQRVFPDYASAIEAGYKPKTMDVSKLVENRVRLGQIQINNRAWAEGLRSVTNPIDGKPVVTDLIRQPKGTFVAPRGYISREIFPGMRVAVSEFFAPLLDSLTGGSVVPKILNKIEGGIKHSMLLIDTFHASRIMQKELFMRGKVSYGKGVSLLEYADKDLDMAVEQNEITKDMAEYAKKNRPLAKDLIKSGLNVGNISDALYKDVVSSIPVVGAFNRFVFDRLTRGAMLESSVWAFEKNLKAFPELSREQVLRKTAKETNQYYGNLGSQGIFKNKTWKDIARIVFLAPQWVESMATTELKAYTQLGKVPVDAATGRGLRIGMLAQGVGKGLLAYAVGTQLLNMATRGHPTWDNPEQHHQWDAWIPDFIQGSGGFFLSPFSVVAELTHDVIRYEPKEKNAIDVGVRIGKNKLSPISHASRDMLAGKDFFGRPLDSVWERVQQAAVDAAPIPLPARAAATNYKGSKERQLFGSLGFKVEPVASSNNQIFQLANDWLKSKGINRPEPTPGDYTQLKTLLRNGDKAGAQKEYDRLAAAKGSARIEKYFSHSAQFTDSRAHDVQFRKTLDREQLEIYNKAIQEREQLRAEFQKLNRPAKAAASKVTAP